jgi:hypothetical protein
MPLWYEKRNKYHKEPVICNKCKNTGIIDRKDCSPCWYSSEKDEGRPCDECGGTGYLNKEIK